MTLTLSKNQKLNYYSTIFFLLILNVVLKIICLDSEPFWYDESISLKDTFLPFGHIKHEAEWDKNPPFYYYCLWVWTNLFGISEFTSRFPSVIFSALSVCFLFVFSRKFFNYSTSLGAALLFTFHNFNIEFSHEARAYSLVVLLVILSSILFFKFLEKPGYLILFFLGLINFLIIYTHYISGFVLFFQFLLVLLFHKPRLKQYLLSSLFVIILVFIRFTKKQFINILGLNNSNDGFWLHKSDYNSLKDALVNLFSGENIWPFFLLLFLSASFFIAIKKNHESLQHKQVLLYCIFLSGLSFIFLFLLGKITPVFLARYLLFSTPFILMIISWLLFNSHKLSALLFIALLGLQFYNLNLNPKKTMDYRLAAHVVQTLKPDLILLQTKDITALFVYYHNNHTFVGFKSLPAYLKENRIYDIANKDDISTIDLSNYKKIVLCQTFEKENDSEAIFNSLFEKGFEYSTINSVKGVKISLVKKAQSQ